MGEEDVPARCWESIVGVVVVDCFVSGCAVELGGMELGSVEPALEAGTVGTALCSATRTGAFGVLEVTTLGTTAIFDELGALGAGS